MKKAYAEKNKKVEEIEEIIHKGCEKRKVDLAEIVDYIQSENKKIESMKDTGKDKENSDPSFLKSKIPSVGEKYIGKVDLKNAKVVGGTNASEEDAREAEEIIGQFNNEKKKKKNKKTSKRDSIMTLDKTGNSDEMLYGDFFMVENLPNLKHESHSKKEIESKIGSERPSKKTGSKLGSIKSKNGKILPERSPNKRVPVKANKKVKTPKPVNASDRITISSVDALKDLVNKTKKDIKNIQKNGDFIKWNGEATNPFLKKPVPSNLPVSVIAPQQFQEYEKIIEIGEYMPTFPLKEDSNLGTDRYQSQQSDKVRMKEFAKDFKPAKSLQLNKEESQNDKVNHTEKHNRILNKSLSDENLNE